MQLGAQFNADLFLISRKSAAVKAYVGKNRKSTTRPPKLSPDPPVNFPIISLPAVVKAVTFPVKLAVLHA